MIDDQGDPYGRIVCEIAVSRLSMLSERFTVVSGENDDRVIQCMVLFQIIEHFSKSKIDVGDFSVIRFISILGFERFRWIVALVGIETVDPEKPGIPLLAVQPFQGSLDDDLRFSFNESEYLGDISSVVVIIDIESLSQAEPRIQRESADKSSGRVSIAFEMFSQSQKLVTDDEIRVVMDAVIKRCRTEKYVCMRRQSRRSVGKSSGEDNSFSCQAVYSGCLEVLRAVTAQPIRTKRIDGDEQNIRERTC